MSKARTRALIVAVMALIGLVAVLGGYAYWTTGGSGSGTASVGDDTDNLTISSTAPGALLPRGEVAVTVTVSNLNSYSVHVNDVSTSIATGVAGCLAADFHFATKTLNTEIAAGGNASFTQNLHMDDTAANQDACKNATLTLTYSSN
jgi:hypothetical protein